MKYQEWIEKQDKEFIKEVCNDTSQFKRRKIKSCSLEELKELDNIFINGSRSQKPKG